MARPEKYLKKSTDEIALLIKKPTDKLSEEDFHTLRTSIKKVKAAAFAIKSRKKSFKRRKVLEAYRNVFKAAGAIREIQLEKKFLDQPEKPAQVKRYLNTLSGSLEKKELAFKALQKKKTVKKIRKSGKQIIKAIKKLHKKDFDKVLNKVNGQLKEVRRKSFRVGSLHEIRKLLKTTQYIGAMSGIPKSAATEQMMEKLGDWHDAEILVGHLKNAAKKGFVRRGSGIMLAAEKKLLRLTAEIKAQYYLIHS